MFTQSWSVSVSCQTEGTHFSYFIFIEISFYCVCKLAGQMAYEGQFRSDGGNLDVLSNSNCKCLLPNIFLFSLSLMGLFAPKIVADCECVCWPFKVELHLHKQFAYNEHTCFLLSHWFICFSFSLCRTDSLYLCFLNAPTSLLTWRYILTTSTRIAHLDCLECKLPIINGKALWSYFSCFFLLLALVK